MKLKRQAEDFQVEEQISPLPQGGAFALYLLTKKSLGTLESVAAIARHWKLPRQVIAFAGLKDKHAQTSQHITIHNGPRRGLKQTNLSLQYVGQTQRPIHASDIAGNRFEIVLRDLDHAQVNAACSSLCGVQDDGLPNYFDDQRFGSLGASGEFIAQPWCLGDYERALWLALAEPQAQAPRIEREQRQILCEDWGDWSKCALRLAHTPWHRVLQFLQHNPTDFRRAVTHLPHDLRSLWLAAYQSHLWNLLLAALIEQRCDSERLIWIAIGRTRLPFPHHLLPSEREGLNDEFLSLPSARLHLEEGPLRQLYDRVLAASGTEMRQLRVKYPRDTFFSKGDRQVIVRPANLKYQVADDDMYPAKSKLMLNFVLPRGSYATILIKSITLADPNDSDAKAPSATVQNFE